MQLWNFFQPSRNCNVLVVNLSQKSTELKLPLICNHLANFLPSFVAHRDEKSSQSHFTGNVSDFTNMIGKRINKSQYEKNNS